MEFTTRCYLAPQIPREIAKNTAKQKEKLIILMQQYPKLYDQSLKTWREVTLNADTARSWLPTKDFNLYFKLAIEY